MGLMVCPPPSVASWLIFHWMFNVLQVIAIVLVWELAKLLWRLTNDSGGSTTKQ
jgi:hypothetical protein